MKMDIITKKTTIKEAREILKKHLYSLPNWWEVVIFSLLYDCKYLEIVGFGDDAKFVRHY